MNSDQKKLYNNLCDLIFKKNIHLIKDTIISAPQKDIELALTTANKNDNTLLIEIILNHKEIARSIFKIVQEANLGTNTITDQISNKLYCMVKEGNASNEAHKIFNFVKKSYLFAEVLHSMMNKLQDDILNDNEDIAYRVINWAKYNHISDAIFKKINNKLLNAINTDNYDYVTKVFDFASNYDILETILTYKYHDGKTLLFICVEKKEKIQFCHVILDKAYEAGILGAILTQRIVWEDGKGNKMNQTPIHVAFCRQNIEIVKTILNKAKKVRILVDVLTQYSIIKDINGDEFFDKILTFAIRYKNINLIEEILEKCNAEVLKETLIQNTTLNFDCTSHVTILSPLYIAIKENYNEAINAICNRIVEVKITESVFHELADYLRYLIKDYYTTDDLIQGDIAHSILNTARYCNSLYILIKNSYTSFDTANWFCLTEHYLYGLHYKTNNTILKVLYELHHYSYNESDEILGSLLSKD